MGDLPASLAAARQRALNGGQRPRPRPLPRTPQQPYRSAFWDAPETNLPYRAPEQALADRNTLPYVRQETLPQRQVRNDMAQLADRSAAGGSTGYAERNQVRELGNSLMEATGAPSWARGIEDIQYGQPGAAIPEFLNGALATSSLATLPYGAGAPIRGFQRPPPRLPPAQNQVLDMAGLGRMASQGFDESDAGFFARMASDEMPTPERALGRPLTPDHIWNDPRFAHRLSITSDLEGVKTPEERFHIAEERIADQLPPPSSESGPLANDLDQWSQGGLPGSRLWMLDELIRRQQEIGPGHDVESLITMARNMRNGEFPRALEADLGEYGVGGSQQNTPLLGTPDIAADPMAFPRRPGFGPRPQLPLRQGPNEDRYLFGRPPIRQSMVGGGNDLMDAASAPTQQPRIVRRTLDAPHAQGYGTGTFEILQNPTRDQLNAFMARELRTPTGQQWTREARGGDPMQYYPLRFVRDLEGNTYVSSGLSVEHSHMAAGLRARGIEIGEGTRGKGGAGQLQRRDGEWFYDRAGDLGEPLDYYYGRRGSNDLAEAAGMRPQQAPDAGSGGAGQEGFNFDEPLYHGTSGAIEGEFIPSRGLELGNGVYVTPDAEFASQHATKHNQGGAVVPLYARQGRYATGEQYRNALDNVGNGRNHDATQAYLESRGYIGVRDGREIVVFRPENLTFRTQSPDGGASGAGNFAWTDDNFTLAGDGGQIRGRLWTNGETGEQALKIDSSATLRPGTGQGVPLYIQAFQEAQRRGLPLVSDQRVSLSASHVYDALARRGYRVERNPTAEQVRGHWVSRDGDPVFRVTDAPNAGPPRTPPRTPPRPRPPRRQQ